MTTSKTSESTAKKDVAKLQRAIVDGLEDVKAQDIQVFNTEHLSPLFERVIVASGTSNRQTKALAASVRDAVKEAGFPKPRTEGEENGEWIIVDCGAAVAHIMQPTIRQYYRLEDLWGEMPVRLKLGAAKPVAPEAKVPVKTAARRAAKAAAATEAAAPAKKAAPRKGASAPTAAPAAKAPARKAPSRSAAPARAAAKAPAKAAPKFVPKAAPQVALKATPKAAPKAAAKTAGKAPAAKTTSIQKLVVKPRSAGAPAKKAVPAKSAAPAKKAAPAKRASPAAKAAPARAPAARKSPAAKAPARKSPSRKA
ncbi:MAG: ribosome silencing factor [Giesbergeria sp.]|jgi:ribosome-associated protein|nr:ribosome silencing factor [Giesbergeria sp.]MBP6160234.1 ribosome silencing factor [Giesbergeria sp.]MBP9785767.1 ribosome silencing factor [Giesbergeria sp.]MBP9895173.1 ribosome silencing factor [Giesbergeria sp.]